MHEITVVIPVYNGENEIEPCIQSVINAGKRVSEIIIVDDGSTDSTLCEAKKLSLTDSRIKVIHTDNHGTYMARRTGMRAASCDYVTSIDADDRYFRGSLDLLAALMEKYNTDAAIGGLVESYTYECSQDTVQSYKVKISSADQMWPRIMKWKTQEFISYINKLYKKELVADLIEADGICQGEDVLITCQVFQKVKRIVETNAPMYLYYKNPDSLTRVGFGDHDLDIIRVWDLIVSQMQENRQDLLHMAQFNRWRTDFTLMCRLILAGNKDLDKKYEKELLVWKESLKNHWKDLVLPHVMPRNRELLIVALRFFYNPARIAMRMGRRMIKTEDSVLLHSGDKR